MNRRDIAGEIGVAANLNIKEKNFWLDQLSGELTRSHFPYDNNQHDKRKNQNKFPMVALNFRIEGELFARLMHLRNNSDSTLHMILTAGLTVLLYKYTGNSDIIIGTPVYKTQLQGEFINTILTIRNRVNDNITFKDLLLQVRECIIQADAHQNYPLEILLKQLNIPLINQDDDCPLFDVAILQENIQDMKYLQHIKINSIFSFLRTDQCIESTLTYRSVRYEKSTIERIAAHLLHLLQGALSNIDVLIGEIDLLSQEEHRQLLYAFNRTDSQYPEGKTIPRLFAQQTSKNPDGIAVIGMAQDDSTGVVLRHALTYNCINEKTNQLAGCLKEKGVVPDTIIGIIMPRWIQMIIGILGILKAGGAYLPIEPDYPKERIRFILEDSCAKVLVTTRTLEEEVIKLRNLEVKKALEVLFIDSLTFSQYSTTQLLDYSTSSSLAYTIYTSGSTGKPKSVMIHHQAVVNFIIGITNVIPFKQKDCILSLTSISFDIFGLETLLPLAQGTRVIMGSEQEQTDAWAVAAAIEREEVTIFQVTPSRLQLLISNYAAAKSLHSITHLLVGGEVFPKPLLEKVRTLVKGKIYNVYGPTETTIWSTIKEVNHEDPLNIGKPIANTRVYILSKKDQVQPLGVPGELCIAGDGLARGYLNRPELTAEKFDHDLWDYQDDHDELRKINKKFLQGSVAAGGQFLQKAPPGRRRQKLYKTGDLARWLPDGNIQFLGRLDYQVKIRGFRVELTEIENQLVRYPSITDAVVMERGNGGSNKMLAAYFVSDEQPGINELRKYLAVRLPEYMIPSHFVRLKTLPLTISGKIDRKALPGIDLSSKAGYEAPVNNIEQALVEAWQDVFRKNRVGIHDNFFAMGGDSITAIQVVSRMNMLGYTLEMRDFFKYPQIAQLSDRVKTIEHKTDQSIIEGVVPLTPIQEDFFETANTDSDPWCDLHHYNHAVILYSREGFKEEVLETILKILHQHHDALRITFKRSDGRIVQVMHGKDDPLWFQWFHVYPLQGLDKAEAEDILKTRVDEIQGSINLETGPLMKWALFRLDDGDRLLIVIHHLVVDGVSWRILLEDFENLYFTYEKNKHPEPPLLPPKTDSLKRWALKLSLYANSKAFLEQVPYWQRLETRAASIPQIQRDFETEIYSRDTHELSLQLNETDTNLLLTTANKAFNTRGNEILLTALALGFKSVLGMNRLLIALEGHGRENILNNVDISRTVGCFTTIFPVILDISYHQNLSRQVKEIKETLRQIPGNGIGYGILKYLTLPRYKENLSFQAQPRVCFNYWGQIGAPGDGKKNGETPRNSFEIAGQRLRKSQNPQRERTYDLEISAVVLNNRLKVTIAYSNKQYKEETIKKLIRAYETQLENLVSHCSTRQEPEQTPSDFAYKNLSFQELHRLQKRYPMEIEDISLLSPMQEGILFHTLYERDKETYFVQTCYRLQGHLDTTIIKKSLDELIRRHDILRTAFVYQDIERPLQVILRERHIDFSYIDLQEITGDAVKKDKESYLREYRRKDRQRPFRLGLDVLLRVTVIRLRHREYEIILNHHHIVMDGWCTGIVISEFFAIYNAFLKNQPHALAPATSYRVFIHWLETRNRETAEQYWRQYLEGYEELVGIPPMGPGSGEREADYKNKNESVTLVLDSEETAALNSLAARSQMTLNTLMQTAWGIVLGKYNGKEDVVFGAVVSGRPGEIPQVESIIGLFINTVPVRLLFQQATPLNQLMKTVQEDTFRADHHSYFPLREIQAATPLKQDLLDHIMAFENYPIQPRVGGITKNINDIIREMELTLTGVQLFSQTNYDLVVLVIPGEQLSLCFQYNGSVYDNVYIRQLSQHVRRVLAHIVTGETLTVGQVTLLTAEEKKRILVDFNDTAASYPVNKTLHRLFEEQEKKTPHHRALISPEPIRGKQHITYRQLNRTANRLARSLRKKGVGPGTVAAVAIERSLEMLAAILAVVKTGGAYLPVDPTDPGKRIKYILADSSARLLIDKETVMTGIKDHRPYKTAAQESGSPGNPDRPNDPVYVIYTSGSTGNPKGVVVEHRSIVNRLNWMQRAYPLEAHDVILQKTPYVFDVSLWEIFWWSLNGASACLLPPGHQAIPTAIERAITYDNVTTLHFVPSMFDYFLEHLENTGNAGNIISLRRVFSSGETLSGLQVKRFYRLFKNRGSHCPGLINLYGPTEATVDVSYFNCPINQGIEERTAIPIGKPIDNIGLYIFDKNGNLQPCGVAGELIIAGVGLARGYLNRVELTAGTFLWLNHPLTSAASTGSRKRIYRSKDLARWMWDGNIEFLGRLDSQVKIRGNRVELGEIRSQLLQHPDIKEAAAIAKNNNRETYIRVYVVSKRPFNTSELREFLATRLPPYMIPSQFIDIEKIPITPSGKIDRKILESYDEKLPLNSEYVAPASDLEKSISNIWNDLLKVEKTGIHDNFFDLGGDSLKALQLNSKLNHLLKKDIPITAIFEYRTISSFVQYLKQRESVSSPKQTKAKPIDRSNAFGKGKTKKSKQKTKRKIRK